MATIIQIILLVIELIRLLWSIKLKGGTPPYTTAQIHAAEKRARKSRDTTELVEMKTVSQTVLTKLQK